MNFLILTLDACRYDTAIKAHTPNFNYYSRWHLCYSRAIYTLPSHIAFFQSGHLPNYYEGRYAYNSRPFFRANLEWTVHRNPMYVVPESENLIQGFRKLDYRTIGVGGVGWFNMEYETSALWNNYFDEFYRYRTFSELDLNGFENQIKFLRTLLLQEEKKLFLFVNVAATHFPYRNIEGHEGQIKALEYIDEHINKLLNLLPRPIHCFIFSDHGEVFGEDGLEDGHRTYHLKVMEVPMMDFILR